MWLSLPRLVGVISPFPILIACASAGARDANVITAPELEHSTARNAYDAIHGIRPEMLRSRDPGTIMYFNATQPLVAVDNVLIGGAEVLRRLPISKVARIEYVNSSVATKRYGREFGKGVMLIETRVDSGSPEVAARPSPSR
jgi:hypothetical protein